MARPTRSSAAGRKDGDDDKDIAVAAGTKPKRGRPARQPAPGIEQTETPAESSSTGIDSVEAPTVKRRRVATRSSSPAPILKKASDSGAGTHSVGSDNIDDDDDDDEPVENLKRTRALATSKSEKSLSKTIASNSKAASKGARTTAATGNAVSMASRTKRRGSLTSGVDEARPKPAASAKQKNNDLEQQNIDDSDEDNLTLDELKKSRMVMDISSNSDDAIVVAAENEDSTTSGRRSSRRRSSMPSAGANSSSEKNVAPTATEISLDTKVTSEHDRPPTTNTSVDEKTTNGTKPKIIIAKESTIPLENVGRNVPAAASAAPAKVKSVLSVKNSSKSTDSGVDTSGDDNAVLQPTTLTSTEEKDSSKAEATKDSGVAFAMLQLASTAPPLLPEDELLATVDENSTKKSSGDPVIDAGVDDMNSNDVPTAQHGEAPTTVIQEQSKEEPVETSESDDVVTVEDSILGLLALAAVDQATPIVTQCDNAMVNADSPRKDTDYVARIEPLAQSNVQTTAMVTSQLDLPATMGAATITKTQEESQKFLQHTSAAIATLAPVATDTANIKLRSEDRLETSPDVPKIADPALNANLSVSTHDNATENAPVERHAELKQGEARTAPKPVALVSTHPVATETVTPVPLSESTFPLQPATKSESPETGSIADPSPNTTSRNKVVNLDSSKEIDVGSSEPKPTTKVATPVTRMPYPAPKNATTANTFPAFHTGMLNFSPEDEPERQYAALQSIELQDQTKSPVLPVSSNIAAKPANAPTPPTQQDVSPHNVSQLKRAGIFPVGLVTSHDTCNDLVSTAGNNSGEGTANQTHKSDLVEQATRSATDKDISMVKPLGTMNTLGDAQAMNDEPPTASIYQMSALSDAGALISPNTRRTDAPPSNQSNMYMETHAASDIKEREAKQLLDVGTITDVGRLIQQQENEHVKPVLESLKEPERSSLQDVQGKNESVVTLPTPQPIALVKVTDTGEETRKVSALSTDTTQGREDTSFSKADSTPIDESAKTVFSDSMTCLAQGSVNADEVVSIAAKSDRSVERFERDQEKVCSDTEEDEMQVELSSAAATKQSDENADLEQGSAPVRQDPLTKLKSIDGVHRRKRSDDDVSLPSKRRRGAFKPPEKEKVVQQSRLNLERIKLLIFAVGMRVHGPQGYERVFSEYWNALSRRLEGQLSDQERSKSQVTVNSFLRTKSLRSLHNKLILGK